MFPPPLFLSSVSRVLLECSLQGPSYQYNFMLLLQVTFVFWTSPGKPSGIDKFNK